MLKKLALATALAASSSAFAAGEVEVLHWWTSGGEGAALNVLKDDLGGKGVSWQDMPVAGGGGSDAMTVLRSECLPKNEVCLQAYSECSCWFGDWRWI